MKNKDPFRRIKVSLLLVFCITLIVSVIPAQFAPASINRISRTAYSFLSSFKIIPGIPVFHQSTQYEFKTARICIHIHSFKHGQKKLAYHNSSYCDDSGSVIWKADYFHITIMRFMLYGVLWGPTGGKHMNPLFGKIYDWGRVPDYFCRSENADEISIRVRGDFFDHDLNLHDFPIFYGKWDCEKRQLLEHHNYFRSKKEPGEEYAL